MRTCCWTVAATSLLFGLPFVMAAQVGPNEIHRELDEVWRPMERGFNYDLTLEHERLAIARLGVENGQRRVVALDPPPSSMKTVTQFRLASAGQNLHMTTATPGASAVLLQGDRLFSLTAEGEWVKQSGRTALSEFNNLPGFVFSPDLMTRHWLGEPWPTAWVPAKVHVSFAVVRQPDNADGNPVFEVTMVAREVGKPIRTEHRIIHYRRLDGAEPWLPHLIEEQTADREPTKRTEFDWAVLGGEFAGIPVPFRVETIGFARNPADGRLVPANRFVATIALESFKGRSSDGVEQRLAVLETKPVAAIAPLEPEPVGSRRVFMSVFVLCVIALAVLVGVRKYKHA